jgi:hypothetical protein
VRGAISAHRFQIDRPIKTNAERLRGGSPGYLLPQARGLRLGAHFRGGVNPLFADRYFSNDRLKFKRLFEPIRQGEK